MSAIYSVGDKPQAHYLVTTIYVGMVPAMGRPFDQYRLGTVTRARLIEVALVV